MIDLVAFLLTCFSLAAIVYAFVDVWRDPRRAVLTVEGRRAFFGVMSLAYTSLLVATVMWHDGTAYFLGPCDAVVIWLWIFHGGGKGPRKRIRRFLRRFKPVRRTAPVMGGA